MAKNKVEIDVKVDDKGTTAKVGVGAKKAAENLDKTGKSAHTADRRLKGAAGASSNTTKNFSKMSQGISGGLVPAYATLAAQLFAVSAAFNFLKRSGDIVTLKRGQEAFASTTGVAMRSLAKDIIAATDAQISFKEASQAAAIGIASGLSPEQLTKLGTAAKQTAAILGRDVTDSFNRLVKGTTKAEPELLDELGIILRLEKATNDYAQSVGKTAKELSAYERTQAVTNDVLAQAETKFGAIEKVVGITVNPFNQLGKAFDDIIITIQEFTAAIAGPLAKVLTDFPLLVGGAFAFFTKGVLTAAIPGLQDFGKNMKLVAANGVANLAALERQALSTQRALAAGLADPKAAASMGSMATKELSGTLQASGLSGGIFKRAAAGGSLGNPQIAKMKKALEKMYGDASKISDEAIGGMIANLDDLTLANKVAHGKMTADGASWATKSKLRFAAFSAQGKAAFASVATTGAKAMVFLGRAMSALGIISLLFSLGALVFNFFKAKNAGDGLSNTLDLQAKRMAVLKEKVKSTTEEYKNFNAVQSVLGTDRGTGYSLALGNRMSAMSSSDITMGLKGERTEGLEDFQKKRAEYDKLMSRIDAIYKDGGVLDQIDERSSVSLLAKGIDIDGAGMHSRDKDKLRKIASAKATKLSDRAADLGPGVGGGFSYHQSQSQEGIMAQLVDEQKGFTSAQLSSSKALREYNRLLDEATSKTGALDAKEIKALATKRSTASADLIRVGQLARLNKEAGTAITNTENAILPQHKYASALTAVRNAIKGAEEAEKLLSGPEQERLERNKAFLPVLEKLVMLERRKANITSMTNVQNAEVTQIGRGSRGNVNYLASGQKESRRLAELNSQEAKRTNLMLDRSMMQSQLDSLTAGKTALEIEQNKEKIAQAQHLLGLKRNEIELIDIATDRLHDEGNAYKRMGESSALAIESSLGNAFTSIVDGSKSASDAMEDFSKNVLASIAKIAAHELAAQILQGVFSAFGSGLSAGAGVDMGGGSTFAGHARQGGIFENAPGYRSGKMPGTYSDGGIAKGRQAGYPAILHGTEAVVPLPNGNKIPVEIKGGGGDQNNINITINSEGGTQMEGSAQEQKVLGKAIATAVQRELVNQKRPGGILSPYGAS